MKKLLILGACGFFLAACNNTPEKTTASATPPAAAKETDSSSTGTTASASATKGKIVKDPVCDMEQGDIKFTDYSIYKKDTVWFCSPHCKKMFDKNPTKYAAKLKA